MDGYTYRRDLLATGDLRRFSRKSDAPALLHLAVHALVIAATGGLVVLALGTWWIWPAYIAHGIALVFVFAPLHECIHGTAFRTKWLNSTVAAICGLILFLPAGYFRRFHFAHHRHTNDAQNDPEMAIAKPSTPAQYLWAMSGIQTYWIPQFKLLAGLAAGRADADFIPESAQGAIVKEARAHIAGYCALLAASFAFDSLFLVHLWAMPLLFGMVALRGFLLAEHAGCEMSGNMLHNTRTTVSNALFRYLAWNMPYHAEHHAFPSVPFHALPKLHPLMKDRIAHLASGYFRFHLDYVRQMQRHEV